MITAAKPEVDAYEHVTYKAYVELSNRYHKEFAVRILFHNKIYESHRLTLLSDESEAFHDLSALQTLQINTEILQKVQEYLGASNSSSEQNKQQIQK